MTLASTTTRSATGQFTPAHSGNPFGRPKGSRNRATAFAALLREGQAEEIVQRFVERALAGDGVALRVCFERLVAKVGAPLIELPLAPGAEGDPAALVTATIRALADGEVTPQEAAAVARVAVAGHKILGMIERRPTQEAASAEEEAAAPEAAAAAEEAAPPTADAGEPAPVIRLFPVAAPVAAAAVPGRPAEAHDAASPLAAARDAALPADAGAAAAPVSGQYSPARARAGGTIRGFIAARG